MGEEMGDGTHQLFSSSSFSSSWSLVSSHFQSVLHLLPLFDHLSLNFLCLFLCQPCCFWNVVRPNCFVRNNVEHQEYRSNKHQQKQNLPSHAWIRNVTGSPKRVQIGGCWCSQEKIKHSTQKKKCENSSPGWCVHLQRGLLCISTTKVVLLSIYVNLLVNTWRKNRTQILEFDPFQTWSQKCITSVLQNYALPNGTCVMYPHPRAHACMFGTPFHQNSRFSLNSINLKSMETSPLLIFEPLLSNWPHWLDFCFLLVSDDTEWWGG